MNSASDANLIIFIRHDQRFQLRGLIPRQLVLFLLRNQRLQDLQHKLIGFAAPVPRIRGIEHLAHFRQEVFGTQRFLKKLDVVLENLLSTQHVLGIARDVQHLGIRPERFQPSR